MAYLNEDGLETLVGKIKGQVIELTSAEYRQLPATKNTDNKLYFVNDEAYAYQIDDEPTSGSTGLVKSGGVYNWTSKIGSGTLTTTAQTLIPAVNELNAKIGSTDISSIGDGTVTGAVDALNNGLTEQILMKQTSGAITVVANNYTYFTSLKPTNSNYTWYLMSVLPGSLAYSVDGIDAGGARAVISGGAGTVNMVCTWLGVKN